MNRMALRVAARYHAKKAKKAKALRVFDFDDTLVSSHGSVSVTMADGEVVTMDSATFAHFKPTPGTKIDFGDFNHVSSPRIIKSNFRKLKEALRMDAEVVILTARAKGASSAVTKFLASQGVKGVKVVALASSDPYDKARWIDRAIDDEGYEDVEFRDDSIANANAVREHGEKHKSRIKFEAINTPYPKSDDDYEGPPLKESFKSDEPTISVLEIKPESDGKSESKSESGGSSSWWDSQTEHFQQNYCREHEQSKYCP